MTINLGAAAGGYGSGLTWQSVSPVAGQGVYDWQQWAVVFHYTTVTVPAGKTVRFTNHPSGAPVVWLVQGDVTIAGTLDLDGESRTLQFARNSIPGPGGFRGGLGANFGQYGNPATSGFGPGGGISATAAGNYATAGYGGIASDLYGNSQILPLIGGSGGAGNHQAEPKYCGGAGGGAILVASAGMVTVTGTVSAIGGDGQAGQYYAGAGSGGSIRILCDQLAGAGTLSAAGGAYYPGGVGRIRLEASTYAGALSSYPRADIVAPDNPPLIWAPINAPTARVVSVGAQTATLDPHGKLEPGGADVVVPNSGLTQVLIECTNLPTPPVPATVLLLMKPKYGNTVAVTATYQSGTLALSTWSANVTLPTGFVVLQVHATF